MADVNAETMTDTLRDALYVGIGATVLLLQKVQVRRQELARTVTTQLGEARGSARGSVGTVSGLVEDRVKEVEDRLAAIEGRLEVLLAQVEDKLPAQARELVQQARVLVARAA